MKKRPQGELIEGGKEDKKWIMQMQDVRLCTKFVWLVVGSSGRHL
jgi:hypothetical protein